MQYVMFYFNNNKLLLNSKYKFVVKYHELAAVFIHIR